MQIFVLFYGVYFEKRHIFYVFNVIFVGDKKENMFF